VREVRDSFLLPLIITASVAAMAGAQLFATAEFSPFYSVLAGIRTFLVLYSTIYITSVIFGEVTFPLDLGKDFHISFNIITFSFVPFLICLVISNIFESLLFVNVIGLYGIYIFWEGSARLLNPPQYKKMPLLIAAIVTAVTVYISTNMVLKVLFEKIYYVFFE
jgi:hypothetical protein